MKIHQHLVGSSRIMLAALMLVAVAAAGWAGGEPPLDEAEVFVELNDTDGDLGIHAAADGEAWQRLEIEAPNDRRLVDIRAGSRMRLQGLTQLFFESAEPTFDELTPEEFFARFPEGIYEISAMTLDGEALESETEFSHVLAAPASNVLVNGLPVSDDCEMDPGPTVSDPVVITWDPVTTSHPEIGKSGPIEVVLYEFVLETDDFKLIAGIPGDAPTEFEAPSGYIALSDEWKLEILVRTETHNNTSIETCFVVE